jgi:hypothetical protein
MGTCYSIAGVFRRLAHRDILFTLPELTRVAIRPGLGYGADS